MLFIRSTKQMYSKTVPNTLYTTHCIEKADDCVQNILHRKCRANNYYNTYTEHTVHRHCGQMLYRICGIEADVKGKCTGAQDMLFIKYLIGNAVSIQKMLYRECCTEHVVQNLLVGRCCTDHTVQNKLYMIRYTEHTVQNMLCTRSHANIYGLPPIPPTSDLLIKYIIRGHGHSMAYGHYMGIMGIYEQMVQIWNICN